MVNAIDLDKLNLEELSGVVSLYPWFALARVELCSRLAEAGACSDTQLAASALYIPCRRKLYSRVRGEKVVDCTDADVEKLINAYIAPKKSEPAGQPLQGIIIAGSDFFSTDQYRSVAAAQDNIEFRPRPDYKEAPDVAGKDGDRLDIYTETLAGIYLEQGYIDEAKDIYSKLILRYPEKSVYFAALIEKINNI